ncbi:hypothetical protein N7448_008244 [Penicillium atrosanguineum]|nr:hypothetical protein N7448_008244 [Penicillium atrosanguineum]
MGDPQMSWHDSTDVLQGIMVGPDACHPSDLSDFRPSGLAMGDSTSNPLLELHLASLESQNQPAFMNQWNSDPQDFYYPNYPSRLTGDQDAWNPLQVTGVPNPKSMSHMNISTVGDPDCGFSKPHYRTPSESGSQYMSSLHSDSGYGSTSCATQSIGASSYGMDNLSSPHIGVKEYGFGDAAAMFDQPHLGPASLFPGDMDYSGSMEGSVKCDHPSCAWIGKCPSDKRKHEARHQKLFKCDEPNCARKEGFGTINDLARHKKCVHNKEPERGPKMMYLCFGKSCPRPNKKWPRLDNFKQHLSRMHNEEDGEALLKKSMDWYETVIGHQPNQQLDDSLSQDDILNETQQDLGSAEMELDAIDVHHTQDSVDFLSSRAATPRPISNTQTTHFPALGSLGLSEAHSTTAEQANTKSETFVSDAADNLINAMTKMMNSRARRPSQHSDEGIEVELENPQLSQPQRQMLQKVLSAALERLSDDTSSTTPETNDDKQDWFQCDICSKRTRLRCEMKKHQKRHERPYGCTFPHCAKSFGSKADWKRHESSQHLHVASWLCGSHDSAKGSSCGRIFYREETYTQHLNQQHRIPKTRTKSTLNASRLDLANQSQFWCGFCNRTIELRSHGPAALDERFNHIDIEHFKKGERGRDWCFSSGDGPVMDKSVAGSSLISEGISGSVRLPSNVSCLFRLV